ncbi:hypothetical protein MMC12_006599 [Toensbergia leucococca]|nr:hypothetical protein [Toensbergia leucococca]
MSPSIEQNPNNLAAAHLNGSLQPSMPPSKHKRPHDSSIVLYEDNLEQLNSTCQLVWTKSMENGHYSSSVTYKKAHVLLLSWDSELDDLEVGEEVNALGAVFEETFNFQVQCERLKQHKNKTAQAYINKIVADWVWEYDGPRTLLIVYFAGHGRKGAKPGDLHLAGKTSPTDIRAHLDSVIWNRTEENLRDTQADVLEIFDCCYAGNIAVTRGGAQGYERSFEFLAAADADFRTPGPGETSFTSALIWALKDLAEKSHRFTTCDLLNKIRKDAPNFSREQIPILSKRDKIASEFIVLEPLSSQTENAAELPSPTSGSILPQSVHTQAILTLKFIFDNSPTLQDIQALGDNLNIVVQKNHLRVNRIMWGGLHARTRDSVFQAASRFKAALARRQEARLYETRLEALSQQVLSETYQVHEELEEVHHEVSAHNAALHIDAAPPSPHKRRRLD